MATRSEVSPPPRPTGPLSDPSAPGERRGESPPPARWRLGAAAVLLVYFLHLAGHALGHGLSWPSRPVPVEASIGLVLAAWFGGRFAAAVMLSGGLLFFLHQASAYYFHFSGAPDLPALRWLAIEPGLDALEPVLAWWLYRRKGDGSRVLSDPRSATLFVFTVPGLAALASALARTVLFLAVDPSAQGIGFWSLLARFYLDRALGMLIFSPPLLILATAWLLRRRLISSWNGTSHAGPSSVADSLNGRILEEERASLGDWLEIVGLAFGAGVLCLLLGNLHGRRDLLGWQLWGVQILLIVWASVRQGLRGGTVVAAAAAVAAAWLPLLLRPFGPPPNEDVLFRPLLEAHLLAQCAAAVHVAAAASWVRRQEKGFRKIVEHIPVVVYSVRFQKSEVRSQKSEVRKTASVFRHPTADGGAEITLVSAACSRVLGCPPDSLLGDYEHWLALVRPEDREVVLAAVGQLARQEQPVTCEYRVQGRWLRDTLAPYRDSDGRLLGWDGIVTDVSEQRTLADDLRRTTSMFNALVSNLPAGVFFVQGPIGQPILVNARARQLLGQREDMAAGLDYLSRTYRLFRSDGTLYPNEELPVYVALREGRTTMRDDIVVHRPDGRRVPLVTWAAPVQMGGRGGPDGAVWVLEDLTALRVSEERYRRLIESLPVMLIQANRDMEVTYINPSTKAITGYDLSELADPAAWKALIHPDDLPRVWALATNALNGQTDRGEVRYRARDGSEKVSFFICQPRYQETVGGRPASPRDAREAIGTTTLLVDITRERTLERELQRAQRLELIGRLSSGIAHDFNNLLGVVLNLTDLASANLPADHPVHTDLKRITEASEQAASLAAQLLAFSKQKPIVPSRVEVNAVTGRSLELLRATLPGRIRLESDLADGETSILADETQFQQVLMNLCLNARDAIPEGGTLRVSTRVESAATPTGGPRGWVCLSVQDSGKGMSEEVRSRIFEPFFSTREGGTGLGLAVVQQIVEAFGGTIEVQSKPGEGARFDVRWPIAPAGRDEG